MQFILWLNIFEMCTLHQVTCQHENEYMYIRWELTFIGAWSLKQKFYIGKCCIMAGTFIQHLFWGGIHHNLFAPTKSGVNSGKVKWGTLQLVNGVQQQ